MELSYPPRPRTCVCRAQPTGIRLTKFIEHREADTGAWRGSVKPTGGVDPGPEQTAWRKKNHDERAH